MKGRKKAKDAGARKQKSSVLNKQKPKKSRKKSKVRLLKRVALAVAVCGGMAIGLAGYYGTKHFTDQFAAWLNKPVDWRISLKLASDKPLDDKLAADVISIAKRNLNSGSARDMEKTAALIQKQAPFANVHFLRADADHMVIHLKPREPALCVMADKLRYLTAEAELYGDASADPVSCPGPIVTGIFASRRNLTFRPDFTLVVQPEEQQLLREALNLVSEGAKLKFHYKSIEYKNYRGFFTVLSTGDVETAMGRAPFTDKLQRLREILEKLAKKGEVATRIELDYEGKAFIKSKKM